jgi:hypothetical protein
VKLKNDIFPEAKTKCPETVGYVVKRYIACEKVRDSGIFKD